MLVLDAADVARLLPWPECIAAVEAAFAAPPAYGVLGLGGFHVKAGVLGDRFAAKINGNFPGNRERGLPTIQGVVVLCDAGDGTPLAIMDSAEITRRRTAAATAVAARLLARADASSLLLIGCGAQAQAQLDAVRTVRDIRRLRCVDLVPERAEALMAASGLEPAAGPCDIVITCTTAREPVLCLADVAPGTFVAAVGADHPDKRELASDLIEAATLVVDSLEQARAFGELHHVPACRAVELGQAPGRMSPEEIIVFDSTGVALEDVAAAALVYERAATRPATLPSPSAGTPRGSRSSPR